MIAAAWTESVLPDFDHIIHAYIALRASHIPSGSLYLLKCLLHSIFLDIHGLDPVEYSLT